MLKRRQLSAQGCMVMNGETKVTKVQSIFPRYNNCPRETGTPHSESHYSCVYVCSVFRAFLTNKPCSLRKTYTMNILKI